MTDRAPRRPRGAAADGRPRQLTFALPHADNFSRDDFLEGPANAAGLALIDSWPDWPNRTMMLIGPEGAGKSHLAAIWAEMSGARAVAADNLTAATVPAALATGALVIENLDPVRADEKALFHLLNLAREQGAYLLLTSRRSATAIDNGLRDLRSRLRAIPVVELSAPDDQLFRALLVKLFADRQMSVDEAVIAYLVNRIERSYAAAREAVEHLDAESLRLGRPVTRALAAEALRGG
jgi:chromosomal replication initiation ATPase DnaA